MAVKVRKVDEPGERELEGLCTLLIDAVHGGASVGFLAPLSHQAARQYWLEVTGQLAVGRILWVAESGEEVIGSVQLDPCRRENGRHRADVQKLLVLTTCRGRGVASALMAALEAHAAGDGRSLLVLDTIAGSAAECVYRHLGWQRVGEIPDYAAMPDGELRATAYYFKRLPG
jgi:acetyltransferase